MSEVLTTIKVARLLGVSPVTVVRLYHRGLLTGYRLTPGSRILIYRESVVNYIRNVQRRPVPDAVLEAG